MKIFNREPVLSTSFIATAIALVATLAMRQLSAEQASLIVALTTGVSGCFMAAMTRPVEPAIYTTVASVIAALVTGYSFDASQELIGAVSTLVLTGMSLLTRGQVSPAAASRTSKGGSQAGR